MGDVNKYAADKLVVLDIGKKNKCDGFVESFEILFHSDSFTIFNILPFFFTQTQ